MNMASVMGDFLAKKWLEAKQKEREATEHRLTVEEEILKAFPAREEGSETTTLDSGVKIRTTGKLSYKGDVEKLKALTATWPESVRPVRVKVELDESLLKAIRTDRPDLWRVIAPALTVKPAKTSIVVEEP